jgi:hypothetical protein
MPRPIRRSLEVAIGLGLFLGGIGLAVSDGASALALTSSGSTSAHVAVGTSITLSGLTASFTLSGDIGTTVTQNGAVTMNVLTNNLLGYTVTVRAAAATLSGTGGNTDTIPIADLKVRETGGVAFLPLSNSLPVLVHTQATPSGGSGDSLSNDYQVVIPNVAGDTYSVTLNYVATTL